MSAARDPHRFWKQFCATPSGGTTQYAPPRASYEGEAVHKGRGTQATEVKLA